MSDRTPRALVRAINHQQKIDEHRFAYGLRDPQDAITWLQGLESVMRRVGVPGHPEDWLQTLLDKMYDAGGTLLASVFIDGWLVMLRHDEIDTSRLPATANDNPPQINERQTA